MSRLSRSASMSTICRRRRGRSLPASLRAVTELLMTIGYHGPRPPEPPDREILGAGQQQPQGTSQPSLMDELQAKAIQEGLNSPMPLGRPEPSLLYSNRSYWYPQ